LAAFGRSSMKWKGERKKNKPTEGKKKDLRPSQEKEKTMVFSLGRGGMAPCLRNEQKEKERPATTDGKGRRTDHLRFQRRPVLRQKGESERPHIRRRGSFYRGSFHYSTAKRRERTIPFHSRRKRTQQRKQRAWAF